MFIARRVALLAVAASAGCAPETAPVTGIGEAEVCPPASSGAEFWGVLEGLGADPAAAAAVRGCRLAFLAVRPDAPARLVLWTAEGRRVESAPLPALGAFPFVDGVPMRDLVPQVALTLGPGGEVAACRGSTVLVFDAQLDVEALELPGDGARCAALGHDETGALLVSFAARHEDGWPFPALARREGGAWQTLELPEVFSQPVRSISTTEGGVVLGGSSRPPGFARLEADGATRWRPLSSATDLGADARVDPRGAVVVELAGPRPAHAYLRYDPVTGGVAPVPHPPGVAPGQRLGAAAFTEAGALAVLVGEGPGFGAPWRPWRARLVVLDEDGWRSPGGDDVLEGRAAAAAPELVGFDGLGRPVARVDGVLYAGSP
jgi:hypothetical protein